MVEEAPDPKEVSNFHFSQLKTLKLIKDNESIPQKCVNIICATSKYGLLFVGIEHGFKILKFENILDVDDARSSKDIDENYYSYTVPSQTPVLLSLSADQKTLAVLASNNSTVVANMYNIAVFADLDETPEPFMQVPLANGTQLLEFIWNPAIDGVYAYCLSDGSLHVHELDGINLKIVGSVSQAAATSACWSPKGKQLVVGKANGTFSQYKPNLQEVKSIPPPKLDQGQLSVRSISWISTTLFAVLYVPEGDNVSPNLMMVSTPKGSPIVYTNFYDVCLGNASSKDQRYFLHYESSWGILVCASTDSIEVAVIGDPPNWSQWDLKEDGKALLPGKDGASHAIGMAVVYCSQRKIIISEYESYAPMPVIFFVTNNGLLVSFHMINSAPDAVSLVRPSTPIEVDGERKTTGSAQSHNSATVQFEINPVSSNASEISTENNLPQLQQNAISPQLQSVGPVSTFGFGQSNAVPTFMIRKEDSLQQASDAKYASHGPSSFQNSASPNNGHFSGNSFILPPTPQNLPTSDLDSEKVHKSAKGMLSNSTISNKENTSGVRHLAVAQRSIASFKHQEPQLPSSHIKPGFVQSQKVQLETSLLSQESDQNLSSHNTYITAVIEEMQNFEKELVELKQASAYTFNIGTKEEMSVLKSFTLNLQEFQSDMTETMMSLNNDIHSLKNVLLESFAMVEEAYSRERRKNDHSYISMLKDRALDPMTAKRMQKIDQHYHYLSTQLQEVNDKLDQDWSEFQQQKKQNQRSVRHVSSTEAIYKTIVNNQRVIHTLRKKIDYLSNKLSARKMENISKKQGWTPYNKKSGQEELSKLADAFLQAKISNQDVEERPIARKIPSEAQDLIKKFLANSSVITVRPTVVYSPSQSRLISKSLLYKDAKKMSESPESVCDGSTFPKDVCSLGSENNRSLPFMENSNKQGTTEKPDPRYIYNSNFITTTERNQFPHSTANTITYCKISDPMYEDITPPDSPQSTNQRVHCISKHDLDAPKSSQNDNILGVGEQQKISSTSVFMTQIQEQCVSSKSSSSSSATTFMKSPATSKNSTTFSSVPSHFADIFKKSESIENPSGPNFFAKTATAGSANAIPSSKSVTNASPNTAHQASSKSVPNTTHFQNDPLQNLASSTTNIIPISSAPISLSKSHTEQKESTATLKGSDTSKSSFSSIFSGKGESLKTDTSQTSAPSTSFPFASKSSFFGFSNTGKSSLFGSTGTGSGLSLFQQPVKTSEVSSSKDESFSAAVSQLSARKSVSENTLQHTNAHGVSFSSTSNGSSVATLTSQAENVEKTSASIPNMIKPVGSDTSFTTSSSSAPSATAISTSVSKFGEVNTVLKPVQESSAVKPNSPELAQNSSASSIFSKSLASHNVLSQTSFPTTITTSLPLSALSSASTPSSAPYFEVVASTGAATTFSSTPTTFASQALSTAASLQSASVASTSTLTVLSPVATQTTLPFVTVPSLTSTTVSFPSVTTVSSQTASVVSPLPPPTVSSPPAPTVLSPPAPTVSSPPAQTVSSPVPTVSAASAPNISSSPAPTVSSPPAQTVSSVKVSTPPVPTVSSPPSGPTVSSPPSGPTVSSPSEPTVSSPSEPTVSSLSTTIVPSALSPVASSPSATNVSLSSVTVASAVTASSLLNANASNSSLTAVIPSTVASISESEAAVVSSPTFFSPAVTSETPSVFGSASVPLSSTSPASFGQTDSSSGFPQTTNASTFSTVSTTPSLFGQTSSFFGQAPTTQMSFFSKTASEPPSFGQTSVTQSSSFGQQSEPFSQGASTFFSQTSSNQTPGFGGSATGGSPGFGNPTSSSGFSFGKSTFGQNTGSFGLAKSVFGQNNATFSQTPSSNSVFGQTSAGTFGQGSFFSGLGGTPSAENASKNVFGSGTVEKTGAESGIFGNSGASTFGAKAGGSFSGSFSSGGGSVAQSGFGAFQQSPQKTGGFGASSAFGSSGGFGSPAAFGSPPAFGSTSPIGGSVFGGGQQAASFSNFASASSPTFGSLASQGSTFGSPPQTQSPQPGFGQSSPFGSVFGNAPSFGGQQSSFGNAGSPQGNASAFSQWRN